MKVKALAKELGKSPREMMQFLRDMNIRVKSDSEKLKPNVVAQIKDLFDAKNIVHEDAPEETKQVSFSKSSVTLKELSDIIEVNLQDIMRAVLDCGLLLTLNSEVDANTAKDIAAKCNVELSTEENDENKPETIKDKLNKIEEAELEEGVETLAERPPVITIMGHVDHGKTLLLDTLRKSNVVDGEAGGITQHIGAYQITHNDKKLTFLDTPGHAAFTSLRARGAQVTDIVILVVAADEGIKPQTVEAIHHAKAAKVPIIVAINKMDKPGANPDTVKQQLSEQGLVAEDWGGEIVMVPISAKKNEGMPELLEMILLSTEMLELKAQNNGQAKGVVIESKLSKTRGPIATVLVKSGALKVGDHFVIGKVSGKVKALQNEYGKTKDVALPGDPVEILGASGVPIPGELLEACKDEKACKAKVESFESSEVDVQSRNLTQVSLETLSNQIEAGDVKQLNLIIKSDVNGSLEGILHAVNQIPNEEVSLNVIHSAPGNITENDVLLAAASSAIIIGFQVNVDPAVEQIAKDKEIDIKLYSIIYEIVEDITKALKGLFKPVFEEKHLGTAEVRQIFKFSKIGKIAGSYVKDGLIRRNAQSRVYRGKDQIHEGKIDSLKRFEDDAREVATGYECGIVVEGFDDLRENDTIQCYEIVEKKII